MAEHDSQSAPVTPDDDLRSIGEVVAELRLFHPEISASSLRFLERENLVTPHRSVGGHRLYSAEDLRRIRQIKAWQAQRLSLAEIRSRLREESDSPSVLGLKERVLALYLAGRSRDAQQALLAHDTSRIGLGTMFGEVLTPILVEVGDRWQSGVFDVSQEKETSESIREVIVELSIRCRAPEARGPVIVAATVLGELHELGLRMVCGVLGEAGYRVVYLGANAAPEHIGEAVARHHPAAVLLSTGSAARFQSVRATIDTIAALHLSAPPRLLVGGAGVAGQEEAIAALGASVVREYGVTHIPDDLARLLA